MKHIKHAISAVLFLFFIFIAFGSIDDKKSKVSNYTSLESPDVHPQEVKVENIDPKKEAIIIKLKEKAKEDWPNDYSTQEYWINEQIEAYDYMRTIDDNSIKKQAERDWPLDFSTQKYWYEEQLEAKKRLE